MRRAALIAILMYALSDQAQAPSQHEIVSNVAEHCFELSDNKKIAMRPVAATPEEFLKDPKNAGVEAAINGTLFGGDTPKDYRPQGIAYLADGHQFADRNLGYVRGYFTVGKNRRIDASETLAGRGTLDQKLTGYWFVIGTHPLLLIEGRDGTSRVHVQAREKRYNYDGDGNQKKAFRSAIGHRDEKVCFAVSKEEPVRMEEWAQSLQSLGYREAINLDGGSISQLAVREKGEIRVRGQGILPTRLMIFAYNPNYR